MSLTPANEVTTRAVKIAIDYRVSQVIIRSRSIKQIMKRANSPFRYVVPPFLFSSPRFLSITSFPLREKEIFDEIEWEGKSIQNLKQFSSKGNGKISKRVNWKNVSSMLQSSTTPVSLSVTEIAITPWFDDHHHPCTQDYSTPLVFSLEKIFLGLGSHLYVEEKTSSSSRLWTNPRNTLRNSFNNLIIETCRLR